MHQDELAERALAREEDILLGPFTARKAKDVDALRREIGLDKDSVERGRAADNAKAWLSKQRRENKKRTVSDRLSKRQTEKEQECFVGNNKLSCYPTTGLQVKQGTWSRVG